MEARRWAATCSAFALCLLSAGQVGATRSGVAPSGAPYVCGGSSARGRLFMEDVRRNYSLWLRPRSRVPGMELTGARVRIIDARNHLVFDRVMEGPWLLIALPEGSVKVEATFAGQLQRWNVVARSTGALPQDLYFDVDA